METEVELNSYDELRRRRWALSRNGVSRSILFQTCQIYVASKYNFSTQLAEHAEFSDVSLYYITLLLEVVANIRGKYTWLCFHSFTYSNANAMLC